MATQPNKAKCNENYSIAISLVSKKSHVGCFIFLCKTNYGCAWIIIAFNSYTTWILFENTEINE